MKRVPAKPATPSAGPVPQPPSRCLDDTFLAHVGHDLRGELATILAGAHFLGRYEKGVTPTGADMIERVQGAGLRLKRLLDELDDAAWLVAPRPLPGSPCRVHDVLEGAGQRVARGAEPGGVEIVGPTGEAGEVLGDPDVLAAALGYVLDFAAARSWQQPVTVSARAQGSSTILAVSDGGGEGAPDRMARLLEPFVLREVMPAVEPSQRRRERLGLGLAIARAMLEASGGALGAGAAEGGGVTLACTLRRAEPSPAPEVQPGG